MNPVPYKSYRVEAKLSSRAGRYSSALGTALRRDAHQADRTLHRLASDSLAHLRYAWPRECAPWRDGELAY